MPSTRDCIFHSSTLIYSNADTLVPRIRNGLAALFSTQSCTVWNLVLGHSISKPREANLWITQCSFFIKKEVSSNCKSHTCYILHSIYFYKRRRVFNYFVFNTILRHDFCLSYSEKRILAEGIRQFFSYLLTIFSVIKLNSYHLLSGLQRTSLNFSDKTFVITLIAHLCEGIKASSISLGAWPSTW
jgi:hypothetical protein